MAAEAVEAARLASSQRGDSRKVESLAPSSMGAICWAAILESISEVGRRCIIKEDPAIREALNESIASLDANFKAGGGWSEERLQAFKWQMSERNKSTEEICGSKDAIRMYRDIEKHGARELEQVTAAAISMPGPPIWGTCL